MNKSKAETLVCPFQQTETDFVKCIVTRCMAWVETGYSLMPEDKSVKIYSGYCKLLGQEES
jgi:hypothetical protein